MLMQTATFRRVDPDKRVVPVTVTRRPSPRRQHRAAGQTEQPGSFVLIKLGNNTATATTRRPISLL